MRQRNTILIAALLALTPACDDSAKSAGAGDKSAKTDAKAAKSDAKPGAKSDAKPDAEPAKPEADAKPEPPKLEPLALEDWAIELDVPAGSKVGETESGDGVVADTLTIEVPSCEVDIELYRHGKTKNGVAEMFKNATGPSGNSDDQFPLKEQSAEGYRVKHSWKIPLGDTMWQSEIGKVLGDHLILCGAGGMMGVEQAQADCAFTACESLRQAKS